MSRSYTPPLRATPPLFNAIEGIGKNSIALNQTFNIVQQMAQGLLFIDMRGVITVCNPAAEALLGVSRKEMLLNPFEETFQDDFFGFSIQSALKSHKAKTPTFITVKSHGQKLRRLEINSSFTTKKTENDDEVDASEGLIVLIQDVTEIKRSEQSASRHDKIKELTEMAAMVAHEIRNPLGGIKGFASLLQRDLVEYPELQRLATYIVEGTESLNRLVNDILDYSHAMELVFEPVDLVHFMEEIILHLNADESVDPRIELRTRSSQPEIIAPIDAMSLRAAILNLTSNAIQAMPEGGELLIDVDVAEKHAIIRVSDTGCGIPKENMEKIFSPFFTTRTKGHGLGLTEVNKIIEAHHGQVDVDSEWGIGTTFTIRLPLRRKKSKHKLRNNLR